MKRKYSKTSLLTACALVIAGTVSPAMGVPVLYSNHYTQPADAPAGFYAGGAAQHIEDMETGVLRFGITANTGSFTPPLFPPELTDSVLADGNPLDPHDGHSWWAAGNPGVTFTFDAPHTAAGLVWTDGGYGCDVYAEFFRGGTSLGIIGLLGLGDDSNYGTTGEDTFFGATDPLGITSIHVWNTTGGIEVDHVQYGDIAASYVPDGGSSAALLLLGMSSLAALRRYGLGVAAC